MGTTRIKVIDLSSDKKQIKTARKHAEKIALKKEVSKNPLELEGRTVESPTPSESSETSPPPATAADKKKASPKKSSTQNKGKKYQEAEMFIDKEKLYEAEEALELLNKISFTKFDPTVEVHINVTEKNIRGTVSLPFSLVSQKEKTYLIFSDKPSAISDKHVIWGNEKTIADIESGKLKPNRDFDAVFASVKFMPHLAKIAKILGPAGLMPNPKNGTITDELQKAIAKGQEGNFEYKTDPTAPIIHTKLGKLSARPEELSQNLKAIITSIGLTKIKKAYVKSTMSPAIKVNINSLIK